MFLGLAIGFIAGIAQFAYLVHRRKQVMKKFNTAQTNFTMWRNLCLKEKI